MSGTQLDACLVLLLVAVSVHCSHELPNVALRRPAFQSSVRGGRPASLAVDGNRNPNSEAFHSCSVMQANPRAWWAVDLGAVFNVKEVAISQRNSYVESLAKFIVAATNVDPETTSPSQLSPSNYAVCATRLEPIPRSTTMTFRCDVSGRYVFVLRQEPIINFQLCEVEVYGEKQLPNVALRRPAFQSSIRGGRPASLAVDGNRNSNSEAFHSCSVMQANPRAWWAVDLGAVFNVKEVAISQRNSYVESLAKFIVAATNVDPETTSPSQLSPSNYAVCATRIEPIPRSTTMTFRCAVSGRYVFVLRQEPIINFQLCEVEVYGDKE